MLGFALPMSVCVQRRNPTRVPRRNMLVVSSDTPVIALKIYQQDTDAVPVDVTTAAFVLTIYRDLDLRHGCWDYGFVPPLQPYVVAQFPGLSIDPVNGRVDIPVSAGFSRWISGRYWFELTMSYPYDATTGIGLPYPVQPPVPNYAQGNFTILSGVIEFKLGVNVPLTVVPELLGNIGLAPPVVVVPDPGTGGTPVGPTSVTGVWDSTIYDGGSIFGPGVGVPAQSVVPGAGLWDASAYDVGPIYGPAQPTAPGVWDVSAYDVTSTYGDLIGSPGVWDINTYDDGSALS